MSLTFRFSKIDQPNDVNNAVKDIIAYLMSTNGDYNCLDNRNMLQRKKKNVALNEPNFLIGLQPKHWYSLREDKLQTLLTKSANNPRHYAYFYT